MGSNKTVVMSEQGGVKHLCKSVVSPASIHLHEDVGVVE